MGEGDGFYLQQSGSILRGGFFGIDCDAECQLVFQSEFGVLGANQSNGLLTDHFHTSAWNESKCQQFGACVPGYVLQGDDACSRARREIAEGKAMRAPSMPAERPAAPEGPTVPSGTPSAR